LTFATVVLTSDSSGPIRSATASSARVPASTVLRSRRIVIESARTSTRNPPAKISAAICPPVIAVSPHSSHGDHLRRRADPTVRDATPHFAARRGERTPRYRCQLGSPRLTTFAVTREPVHIAGGSEPVGAGTGWALGSTTDGEVPGAGATLARSQGALRTHRSSAYSSCCQHEYAPGALGQPAECHGCQPAASRACRYTGSVSAAGLTERQVRS